MKAPKKKLGFDRRTAARVLRELGGHRASLFFSLLFALGSVLLTLYIPLLTGDAIDLMIDRGLVDLDGVLAIALQIGVCALLCALCQWLMNVLNNRITYAMVHKLRRQAFEKLQRLPLSYLDRHAVGETVSRMMNDVDQFT
ncbi:MAG: ABC transporter ATP-binding protein, partial [Clostridia bacterium]|nr:ABC transporter ATP-binding protein [Clostridia bacterium]